MTAKIAQIALFGAKPARTGHSCQTLRKSPAFRPQNPRETGKDRREQPKENVEENAMDQSLKSPGQSALDDAFHRLFDLSRSEPAPTLEQRLDRLARLRAVVADNEARFEQAISADFGHRSSIETLFAESMFLLGEIKHTARHLKKWMTPRRVATALQFMPAKNRLIPQPLGVVGIIAPWNYPLQLTLAPAVGAIAAGNRVMIKPSDLVPRFSALLKEVISAKFDAGEMVVTGIEEEIAKSFAALPFDHLIFTGSTRVGRLVAEAAGRNLTPITLELGGKSPAIVDRSADLAEAAQRIAYGKLLNAGQTCIAPDYALVPEGQVQDFADKVQASMRAMFGTSPDN
jgi:coniferyl-aldehyde dehydrogenase